MLQSMMQIAARLAVTLHWLSSDLEHQKQNLLRTLAIRTGHKLDSGI